MIQLNSEQGAVTISNAVFSNITGIAATNCFGVKGMAYRSMECPSRKYGRPENLWLSILWSA